MLFSRKKKVGIDIVEVSRFLLLEEGKENTFLKKVFTEKELEYCFSYKNPSVHLAGHFALKEAVSKALGVKKYPFAEIEVFHEKDGAPYVKHHGKVLNVGVSISHTDTLATAIAAR
jgi:holo-[acyl-carrier protein] synthase